MTYTRTSAGFRREPGDTLEVKIVADDKRFGTVIWILGKREKMELRVTPGGKLVYTGRRPR